MSAITRRRAVGFLFCLVLASATIVVIKSQNSISDRLGSHPSVESWRLITSSELTDDGAKIHLDLIVSARPGFVAMGKSKESVGAWYSVDGENWNASTSPDLIAPAGVRYDVRHLVSTADKIVAIGAEIENFGFSRMVAWESDNGVDWKRDRSFPETIPDQIISFFGSVAHSELIYFKGGAINGLVHSNQKSTGWHLIPTDQRGCSNELMSSTDLGATMLGSCIEGEPGHEVPVEAYIATVGPTGEVREYGSRTDLNWATAAASLDGVTVVVGFKEIDGSSTSEPAFTRTLDGGETWSAGETFPIPDDVDIFELNNVSSVGGILVVTGSVMGSGGVPLPALWTSVEHGKYWKFHRLPAFSRDGRIEDVVEKDGRILILAKIGYSPTQTAGLIVNF